MIRFLPPILLTLVLALLVANPTLWLSEVYPRADLVSLMLEHLALVAVSSLAAVAVGVGSGVLLALPALSFLRPVGERFAALGQTFPPAAVLALTVPVLGFGFAPTVLALFLYGTLPILRGTLSGLDQVPVSAIDAAVGLGYGRAARLGRVELPLAWPYLWAGVRTSVVVNVGTATLGATIGAGGLGAPIVSGLVTQNYTFLWEGSLTAGLLALTIDAWFGATEGKKWRS